MSTFCKTPCVKASVFKAVYFIVFVYSAITIMYLVFNKINVNIDQAFSGSFSGDAGK